MAASSHRGNSISQSKNPAHIVVCVCTKDRPMMFGRCLDSLIGQKFSRADIDLQIIVVDNSANARERLTVTERASAPVPVNFIHEPTPGIPNARNAALNALEPLSPDWVAFIDDDEIAPTNWISRLHEIALHLGADVLSGKVFQLRTADEAQSEAEKWRPSPSFGDIRPADTCATSNVIFRAWLACGPQGQRFDEAMRYGGSDTEFFMRAQQNGARIFTVNDATVFEEFPPERRTLFYDCMRAFRVGATTNYRYKKNYSKAWAILFLGERVTSKITTAVTSTVVGILTFPFDPSRGKRAFRRSARNVSTAFGCIGPMFGIYPQRYW